MNYGVMIVIRSAKSFMQDILNINSCFINQDLVRTLIRFGSGHHGQILHGSITSDLSECYGNLVKIQVGSPWPNLTR